MGGGGPSVRKYCEFLKFGDISSNFLNCLANPVASLCKVSPGCVLFPIENLIERKNIFPLENPGNPGKCGFGVWGGLGGIITGICKKR